jgi:putative chitinase
MADTKMHIDRQRFFAAVRHGPFPGRIDQRQVDGLNHILDYAEKRNFQVWDELASMLGQAYLETGKTMQPVREAYYMGSKAEAYLKTKKYYPWVGEGLIQVTWEANHKKFGATQPGQMMTWDKALPALFDGMLKGMFTGRKLDDYFHGPENARVQDWRGARAIVNPKDYKTYDTIATWSKQFYQAIINSLEAGDRAAPVHDMSIPVDPPLDTHEPIPTVDKDLMDTTKPPDIGPQPAPTPSLLSRIFARFDLHMFRRPDQPTPPKA